MVDSSTAKENIEIQEVESGGDAYIAGIKILEVICYIVASVLSSFIFIIIFEIQTWDFIYFGIIVILATLVSKSQLLLWIYREYWVYRKCSDKKIMKSIRCARKFIKDTFSKFTIVLLIAKLSLFNLLSDCFLLLLFFFPSMMLLVFVKYLLWEPSYSYLFNWGLTFFGATGVLLGIFQYYLHTQRNTAKKAAEKLDNMVKSIIYAETIYDNFRKHVSKQEQYNLSFRKHVEEISEADVNKVKKIIISRERLSSEQCYITLDKKETKSGKLDKSGKHVMKEQLLIAYREFFFGRNTDDSNTQVKGCKCKIIEMVTKNCNLAELGSLFLSNINMILDDGQEFIFGNLGDQFWMAISPNQNESMTSLDMKYESLTKDFETHTDYMNLLTQEVLVDVIRLIFEPYFKQKCTAKQPMPEQINK